MLPERISYGGLVMSRKLAGMSFGGSLAILTAIALAPGPWAAGSTSGAAPAAAYVRVVDHNVHGDSAAIDAAVTKANETSAQIILLQEVCRSQYEAIAAAHPGWSVEFKADHKVCGPEGAQEQGGNVAIWRGGSNATRAERKFPTQAWLPDRKTWSESGVVCVVFPLNGFPYRACSTHLVAIDETKSAAQAAELRDWIRGKSWITGSTAVIVGGDFNMVPTANGMDHLYTHGGGNGDFYEAHRNTSGLAVRAGAPTLGPNNKVDYIFISKNVFSSSSSSSIALFQTSSDHKMLLSRSTINQ